MLSSSQPTTGKPVSTCMVQGDKKRLTTTYPDGREVVEEYSTKTQDLLLRKWRRPTQLGAMSDWIVEVGVLNETVIGNSASGLLLKPSSSAPVITRKDTKSHFVWRIRNAVWPKDVYSVTIEKEQIVVRTSNKKYFTRIDVPDMKRMGLTLETKSLDFDWGSSTLLVCYRKPEKIMQMEASLRKEVAEKREDSPLETNQSPQCPQQ